MTYAMGWVVNDYRSLKVVGHGGLIDGFRIRITLVPEKDLGFAVLTNLHDTRMPMAANPNTLIDLYCDLKPKDWNAHCTKLEADARERAESHVGGTRQGSRSQREAFHLRLADYAGRLHAPDLRYRPRFARHREATASFSSFVCPLEQFYDHDRFRIAEGFFRR